MGDLVFGESFGDLAAHHVQGVAESLGQNQPGLRAGARDQRVIADGTGMKEQLRCAQAIRRHFSGRAFWAASSAAFSAP